MSKRKDFTQTAFDVVQRATGAVAPTVPTKKQESARKGGLVGGVARAAKTEPAQRRAIAKLAAKARWAKTSEQ